MKISRCLNCGRKFISLNGKKFCSSSCLLAFSKRLTFSKKCKNCMNYFESRDRNAVFCSKKCKHQHHISEMSLPEQPTKKCLWCGNVMIRGELRDSHWNNLKYCSRKCLYDHFYATGRWIWAGGRKPPEEYLLEPKKCLVCRQIMKLPKDASRIKKAWFAKKMFCSKACYDKKYRANNLEKIKIKRKIAWIKRKRSRNNNTSMFLASLHKTLKPILGST